MSLKDKYEFFLNKLFNDTPDFMKINEYDDEFIILDRFVIELGNNAMPWLFKVYLEEKYKILSNDKFTLSIRNKYSDLKLKVTNFNGNLFFNSDGIYAIIKELEENNQITYCEEKHSFVLI